MTRALSYPLKLPLLREADDLGFQEEAADLHPWELCMMEQGIWPGLAWQELQESARKGATEKTLTHPKIPFCVSDNRAPCGLQSHD